MPSPKARHAVERVRTTYRQYGRPDVGTAAGFARMLGCSSSLIRNVESGIFPLSEKLAISIEQATGVSAAWLQNNPSGDAPILDVQGKVWTPRSGLNLTIVDELLDMAEVFYMKAPDCLPVFMGAVMESLLTLRPPQSEEQIRRKPSKQMSAYFSVLILPVLRMIGALDPAEYERFFTYVLRKLQGEHAPESARLMKMWHYAAAVNSLRSVMDRDHRSHNPSYTPAGALEAAPGLPVAPKTRATAKKNVKRKPPNSVS